MNNYLKEIDVNKFKFINNSNWTVEMFDKEVYYYEQIDFSDEFDFNCDFSAVKVKRTTIVLIEKTTQIKVHLSDKDVHNIIKHLKKYKKDFYEYLKTHINKIINKKNSSKITFTMEDKVFTINGIPFSHDYENIVCENVADIKMNGNDLIGLLNLIIEKERTDTDPKKVIKTLMFYLS